MSKKKKQFLKNNTTLNPHPEKIQDELFQANDFFDAEDNLQVKYEMLRRVRVDGWNISQSTAAYGVSRPLYYKTLNNFEREGLVGLLPDKRGPKNPHKLTKTMITFIQALLKSKSLTSKEITEAIYKKFKITLHPRTIEKKFFSKKKHRKNE